MRRQFALAALVTAIAHAVSGSFLSAAVMSEPPKLNPAVAAATPCMKDALLRLELRCDGLSDAEKRQLALGLLNCHLSASGRPEVECDPTMQHDAETCTKHLDDARFQLFTMFLQHADNVCHFLQAELWNDMAHSVAHKLLDSTEAASIAVLRSKQLQERIVEGQNKLLSLSAAALLNEQRLKAELDAASQKLSQYELQINALLERVQAGVKDDYQHINHSLESIRSYTDVLLRVTMASAGETFVIKSLVWYSSLLVATFLMTGTKRTQAGRFWAIISVICSLGFEVQHLHMGAVWGTLLSRITLSSASPSAGTDALFAATLDTDVVWAVRKACVLFVIGCVILSALCYRPYGQLNHALLVSMANRIHQLEHCIEDMTKTLQLQQRPYHVSLLGDASLNAKEGTGQSGDEDGQEAQWSDDEN